MLRRRVARPVIMQNPGSSSPSIGMHRTVTFSGSKTSLTRGSSATCTRANPPWSIGSCDFRFPESGGVKKATTASFESNDCVWRSRKASARSYSCCCISSSTEGSARTNSSSGIEVFVRGGDKVWQYIKQGVPIRLEIGDECFYTLTFCQNGIAFLR